MVIAAIRVLRWSGLLYYDHELEEAPCVQKPILCGAGPIQILAVFEQVKLPSVVVQLPPLYCGQNYCMEMSEFMPFMVSRGDGGGYE